MMLSLPDRFAALGAIVGLLLACACARAQVSAAAPATEGRGPGHGWVALPGDDEGHMLWHLPPRLGSGDVEGVASGTLRNVMRLSERPEAMAAWGREAWLITAPRRAGDDATLLRRIYRVGARQNPVAAGWIYADGGRLRAEPPLIGGDRLIAAAGSAAGLCILLNPPGQSPALWRLEHAGWIAPDLPEEFASAPATAAMGLVALADGIGLWMQDAGALTMWRGETAAPGEASAEAGPSAESVESVESAAASSRAMEWERLPLAGQIDTRAEAKLWSIGSGGGGAGGGRIVATEWAGRTTLRISDLSGDRAVTLAEMEGVDPLAAAAALDGSRRIAIVWRDAEPSEDAAKLPWNPRRIIEISTDDGSVMYDGQALSPGPVSAAEFKLLAIALVLISAGALVFIVRPDEAQREIALPDGNALAPARIRTAAGLIDGSLAWLIAGGFIGAGSERLGLTIDYGGVPLDFAPLLGALLLGWGIGTLTEWLTGRSPGKWIAGCGVVSVRPGDQRPGLMRAPRFWQALVRNFVKYPLAPIAIVGLASPALRHRGDALALTAVVIPILEERPADDRK